MPANLNPVWDFQGPFGSAFGAPVGVPLEWLIHSISIQRMPQGLAGEDDAGGRISAADGAFQVMASNVPCLVVDVTTAEGGPEEDSIRLVYERRYEIYTATDLTTNGLCRTGDLVVYGNRNLNVTSLENVKEQFVLWKIHATEHAVK